jgi:hypothetical protein
MWKWIEQLERKYESAAPARRAPELDRSALLRPLPNEDVFLFVKPIDNSTVIRQSDPREGRLCWQAFAGTLAAAGLMIALLGPSAYRFMAGYQLAQLEAEEKDLLKRKGEAVRRVAELQRMERLVEMARGRGLVDDAPKSRVEHLQPAVKGALAMNLQSLKNPGQ